MSQTNPPQTSRKRFPRIVVWGVGLLAVIFVALQFVRFFVPEFKIENPPITQNVVWDSPETQQLWKRACADCHSNETVYPWYSYIAPVGWLVARDTNEGREAVNISVDRRVEWDEFIEQIQRGTMPLPIYTTIHADAKLTDAEKQALMDGIRLTFR